MSQQETPRYGKERGDPRGLADRLFIKKRILFGPLQMLDQRQKNVA
jgi:hypothetical protein